MPLYLDTRGHSNLAIGVCGRCGIKMPLDELSDDPNYPGLKVCRDDRDQLDPWRLAPRALEKIAVDEPRPDVPVSGDSPVDIYANLIGGISRWGAATPWQPSTAYGQGATITPQDVNDQNVDLPQYWFLALNAGTSGAIAPAFPKNAGVKVTDGGITWQCLGIFTN